MEPVQMAGHIKGLDNRGFKVRGVGAVVHHQERVEHMRVVPADPGT